MTPDEVENLQAIVRYCAQPTCGWNPGDGTIEEWVQVAPEALVRMALLTVIRIAKAGMT